MLKYALLASAVLVASPVVAQQQPSSAAPSASTMPAPADQTAPAPADPAATTDMTASTGASTGTTADTAATGGAAAGPAQIAQVVETEFPTYDKNADGALNSSEFSSWMVALRSASDPSAKAGSKEMKSWTTTAFAQADTDKSKSVSKAELTGFLAKGQS